ncbi:hypothetical protein ACKAMS_24810 [Rhodococcus sp. 5A-K4]|uniref:hypothetical protein n=1 Tax=Rhodococcus sp. 5A-K4 TaxID=3384442 RepID=UPI0038D39D0E
MRFFDIEQAAEFLVTGSVRTHHEQPVPIWAGFIIEQLAEIARQNRIIMSNQDHLNADVALLIEANTRTVALLAEQGAEIASLKAQAPESLDFGPLDEVTAKLTQLASAVPSNPVPAVDPSAGVDTAPVVSEPVDTTAPVEPVTADHEVQAPIVSETPIADQVSSDETDGTHSF